MRTQLKGSLWVLCLASMAFSSLAVTTSPKPTLASAFGSKTTSPAGSDALKTNKTSPGRSTPGELLPMVINTWNFTAANVLAWRILKQSKGGLRQTRNAVVEGCSKCEKLQCDRTVGYGGSPDESGETTLDAMVIDGSTLDVGAVAGLRRIKDAIKVARHVLEHTQHTMLVGDAASAFANAMGFESESLVTPESKDMWLQWTAENCQPNFWWNVYPDPKVSCGPYKPRPTPLTRWKEDRARNEYEIGRKNHDTIGMIAIDVESNIHAGTSTNGARHKIPGRVGDSPIPGAGAYADNEVGAAVATGDGDVMMRFLPALLAVEAMRLGKPPAEAAEVGLRRILKHYKDFMGAVIAVDRLGNYAAACYGLEEFPFIVSSPVSPDKPTRLETVKCIAGPEKLQRLYLAGCRQLNCATIRNFLTTQPQLSALDLSATMCVNDENLAALVQTNPQLEHLKVNGCLSITNVGAIHLAKLKRLKSLDISNCDGLTSSGIIEGVASEENHIMEELNVSYLQICEECIKAIASNLRCLRSLHLNHCVNGATDEALQSVIGQLRWLRELSLEHCNRLTDAALTGINISKLELSRKQSGSQVSSMDNFYPPFCNTQAERDSLAGSLQSIKISLRSKAEDEIVRDARRKQAMLAAYEMNLIREDDFEGHNIQQLRGLRSLNLRGCNKISDVSLKYGLKHIELRRLMLSSCQQISLLGMEAMVSSCPSIEELDLSDCYNITDKTIQVVTAKLPRLRSLHISGCSQLTEHTLDAIINNCNCLQTLSIYRCRSMYTDLEERLSGVRTLRNLNMDNLTSIDNAEFFRLKKRLDY